LEFFEARNAVRIAESEGAEQYASDSYQHAVRLMDKLINSPPTSTRTGKAMIAVAREVVQTAEDASSNFTIQKDSEQERPGQRNVKLPPSAQAQRPMPKQYDATRQKQQAPRAATHAQP
jgi:hypothetical protein